MGRVLHGRTNHGTERSKLVGQPPGRGSGTKIGDTGKVAEIRERCSYTTMQGTQTAREQAWSR